MTPLPDSIENTSLPFPLEITCFISKDRDPEKEVILQLWCGKVFRGFILDIEQRMNRDVEFVKGLIYICGNEGIGPNASGARFSGICIEADLGNNQVVKILRQASLPASYSQQAVPTPAAAPLTPVEPRSSETKKIDKQDDAVGPGQTIRRSQPRLLPQPAVAAQEVEAPVGPERPAALETPIARPPEPRANPPATRCSQSMQMIALSIGMFALGAIAASWKN